MSRYFCEILLLQVKERAPYLWAVIIVMCWFGFDLQRGWILEKLLPLMDQRPSWAFHVLFIIGLCIIIAYVYHYLFVKEKYLSHQFRAFWYSVIAVYLYYRIEETFAFRGFDYGIAYLDLLLIWGFFLFCYDIYRLYHSIRSGDFDPFLILDHQSGFDFLVDTLY